MTTDTSAQRLHLICGAMTVGRVSLRQLYRPRILGQWFDGIRIYAAASSPPRSRRTQAGLR